MSSSNTWNESDNRIFSISFYMLKQYMVKVQYFTKNSLHVNTFREEIIITKKILFDLYNHIQINNFTTRKSY